MTPIPNASHGRRFHSPDSSSIMTVPRPGCERLTMPANAPNVARV